MGKEKTEAILVGLLLVFVVILIDFRTVQKDEMKVSLGEEIREGNEITAKVVNKVEQDSCEEKTEESATAEECLKD